jgi:hypothetical protein
MVIGGLHRLQHCLVEHLDLRVALDDVPPPLLGQLDGSAAEIVHGGANRHDDPVFSAVVPAASWWVVPPNAADSRRAASARGL